MVHCISSIKLFKGGDMILLAEIHCYVHAHVISNEESKDYVKIDTLARLVSMLLFTCIYLFGDRRK